MCRMPLECLPYHIIQAIHVSKLSIPGEIQAVTFLSPNPGGHQQPFGLWSREVNIPKQVTLWQKCQRSS